jgi:FtsZ-interacting cell division protein YlmF
MVSKAFRFLLTFLQKAHTVHNIREVLHTMSNIMMKLKNWVTGDPFEEEEYMSEMETHAPAYVPENTRVISEVRSHAHVRAVSSTNASFSQVIVIEPRSFEDALEVVSHLKARKAAILNLHLLDTNQSQRVVDFLSGATHAIEGHQQRIGEGVFIFTPNNVSIASELGEEVADGLSLSQAYWN